MSYWIGRLLNCCVPAHCKHTAVESSCHTLSLGEEITLWRVETLEFGTDNSTAFEKSCDLLSGNVRQAGYTRQITALAEEEILSTTLPENQFEYFLEDSQTGESPL